MKKIAKIVLYVWTAILLLAGFFTWWNTSGSVQSTEFSLQISILNRLGMIMIWFALFTVWYAAEEKKETE